MVWDWTRDKAEIERFIDMVFDDGAVDEDGAFYWKRSGHFADSDGCDKLDAIGITNLFSNYDRAETIRKATEQYEETVREYRSHRHTPTAEEMFEMRAAFGEGVTIVDVISGETYTT